MLSLMALPLLLVTGGVWIVVLPPILLAGAQWPMVVKMVRRTRDVRYAAFGVLGFGRAFFRAIGMVGGAMATAVGMYRADR